MKTGEGKTLTATMAVYTNALSGKGVHVVTVNEYLASRDADWMGRIYRFLGLTVGVNLREKVHRKSKKHINAMSHIQLILKLVSTIFAIIWQLILNKEFYAN